MAKNSSCSSKVKIEKRKEKMVLPIILAIAHTNKSWTSSSGRNSLSYIIACDSVYQ